MISRFRYPIAHSPRGFNLNAEPASRTLAHRSRVFWGRSNSSAMASDLARRVYRLHIFPAPSSLNPSSHQDRLKRSTSETYRATFGGALASRELGFGRSGSDRYLSLHCGLVTRVSGRTPFGAYCPKRSLAREASTLSLATCLPGFPGVVLIPLGRLSTSPIPLLARVALWFHHPHLRAGDIHGRPKRRAQDASPAQEVAREVA